MSRPKATPSGQESPFGADEIIVSKTDPKGRITYANDVFLRVSHYREAEVMGQPHNLIRHPDMPHSIFKFMWQTIQGGEEIFAYVLNMARNGDHYWVFAHVTPSFDALGGIAGYHSNRRKPDPGQIARIEPLYRELRQTEQGEGRIKDGMTAALNRLGDQLNTQGMSYDRFVFSV